MKRVRNATGGSARNDGSGDASETIPGGSQITHIRVIPGTNAETGVVGTWVRWNNDGPMFITVPLILCSDTFGYCCECDRTDCDRYPGEQQIEFQVGTDARPHNTAGPDGPYPEGAPAVEWEVFYIEGWNPPHRHHDDCED